MKILALEPYYGGSHKAFLDGWSKRSNHEWTLLTLPAYKWKWRMRHGAVEFARQTSDLQSRGGAWDLVYCSDMLNLAEFLGLVPAGVRTLPSVAYFHENQFTYPVRQDSERDYQFCFTNLTTALSAAAVWFNSGFHQESFLEALEKFLKKMPDRQPLWTIEEIKRKSTIHPPGIDLFPARSSRPPGPLRIVWAARWEHDKNPEDFFKALKILQDEGVDFRVSVIGEQFRDSPKVFEEARKAFNQRIDRWGFQEPRDEYSAALCHCDVFVSTANHEFFGITAAEAMAAGAYPVLPKRLSYPEILGFDRRPDREKFFYDGSPEGLAGRLKVLAGRAGKGSVWDSDPHEGVKIAEKFDWERLAPRMDETLLRLSASPPRKSRSPGDKS